MAVTLRCRPGAVAHPNNMSKVKEDVGTGDAGLRIYRAPWKGQIVLVCRKCEKKLKHKGKKNGLAKLGKELKSRTKRNEESRQLRVVEVSCLKMCPKGGVTVCTQQQLSRHECSIIRSRADVDALVGAFSDMNVPAISSADSGPYSIPEELSTT